MTDDLNTLKSTYLEALDRLHKAQKALNEAGGNPGADLTGEGEPPEISKDRRAAENEAREAWDAYIPARDRYWQKRWGVEGNPPSR